VVVSAATTFMTVRQSAKRGLMQTNVDPDNPMAQSQKYMMYIVPFFSLTGLYWQYGLVLYWVTTNLWTLGQQFFMFRNWTTDEPVGAEGALAGATTGGTVRATQSSLRPGSARPGSSGPSGAGGSGAAKTASGGARTGTASGRAGSSGPSGSGAARVKGSTAPGSGRTGNGSGGARTGTASRSATGSSRSATGQDGAEKRGLLRLGRPKQEPEPQDDVPAAKVVRQQPVRQARSKRSGKR
jgi:YidC/Oxa1 family membrane protein insertase